MRTRVPLFSAALAALLLPACAFAGLPWGQPSRDWDVVEFKDVNGQTLKLWYNSNVSGSLFELSPTGDGKQFQAKRTGYQWKPGSLDADITASPVAPMELRRQGIVTRQGVDDTDTEGASDYQAAGEEYLPSEDRTFWDHYWFGTPAKTVLFPTDEKLQPTPFRLLKGPVELSAAEKAAAKKGDQAVPPADSCYKQGSSAAEAIANCFSPLELSLGDGQTLDNGSGAKITVLPAADDPVIGYWGSGDGRDVQQYIALQRQSLAAAAGALVDQIDKGSNDSRDSFLAGEDRLVIKLAASLGQTDAFYAELRDDADHDKLADFVGQWRGKLLSTLKQYVTAQGAHVPVKKTPPARTAPPAQTKTPPPQTGVVAQPQAAPAPAFTPDQIQQMRERWGK